MEVIKFFGKIISIAIGALIYLLVWMITWDFLKDGERCDAWEQVLSIVWLSIHIVAFIGFLFWCWTN